MSTSFCSECGKKISRVYPGNTCQGCYRYFLNGGTINETPNPGEIKKDHRGFVVCHICGRAYKRLGSHIRESHLMNISEYKEKFGLCNNAKTTEAMYSEHMRGLAYKYKMPERLAITGVKTRIKPGDRKLRYGKKSRLQECLDRSARYTKERFNENQSFNSQAGQGSVCF